MKTLHTPGPWVARRDGAVGPTSKEDDQSFGMLLPVAYVEGSDWPDLAYANAHLIAAAPELLEALRGMLALDEEHHQRGHCDDDVCAEVRKALAAIAKATGGEA